MKIFKLFSLIMIFTFSIIFGSYSSDTIKIRVRFVDTNIVIVNAGHLNRGELTKLINNISICKPKVMGINLCLYESKHTPYDSTLRQSLSKIENLVLYAQNDSCKFLPNAQYGNVTFVLGKHNLVGGFVYDTSSFPYKIIKSYAPEKLIPLDKRKDDPEILIKRMCSIGCITIFPTKSTLEQNFLPEWITGKIVLIGYLGEESLQYVSDEEGNLYMINETEDAHFTPVNKTNFVWPDMFATEIIANILSMILAEEY